MSLGTWVVIIVAIVALRNMYVARQISPSKNTQDIIKKVMHRMDKIEERMANIETIVLEKEKEHRYDAI